ncbi:hypothetical protein OG204_02000 [Streptomyces sp. NBC_01387]|nr:MULTISPECIES: hypothetical protein [unclassified Streptomyces]
MTGGHALRHRVDPCQGLIGSDFVTLDEWLRRIFQAPPPLGSV